MEIYEEAIVKPKNNQTKNLNLQQKEKKVEQL